MEQCASFKEAGGEVVLVLPDPPDRIAEYVQAASQRMEDPSLGSGPPFPVAWDSTGSTMRAWGVWHIETSRGEEVPQPVASTFIVDPEGTVRFKHIGRGTDHADRPDVEVLLAVVRFLAGAG